MSERTEGDNTAYDIGREQGYFDGLSAGRRERVERLELQLADLRFRYDGLIKYFIDIEMMKPPASIIITDSEQLKGYREKGVFLGLSVDDG